MYLPFFRHIFYHYSHILFNSPYNSMAQVLTGIWFVEEKGFDKLIDFLLLTQLISSKIIILLINESPINLIKINKI